ncbi:MAG: inorganic phosphate transporter, partial [Deltaproteobacteria bacterium]|nr:inorganic phosphate transporter [Deltaproteobacteria bacterium]
VHYAPVLIFSVVLVLILSFIFKGLKNLHLEFGFFYTVLLTIPCAAMVELFARKWLRWQVYAKCELGPNLQGFSPAECFFAQLQILTSCYIAFAHGANDVANAVGPLAAIFSVIKTKSVVLQVEVPFWMLLIGGIAVGAVIKTKSVVLQVEVPFWMLLIGGIAVGAGFYIFGTRVLETIGKKITEITPIRGFCAQFGAATTILMCSRLGLPVSTTHVLVGSVVGVGLMRGIGALDLRILKNIGFSWIVTLPITMVMAMLIYKVLTLFLL